MMDNHITHIGTLIEFDRELPEEHIAEVQGILNQWKYLLPSWLLELRICQAGSDHSDTILSTNLKHHYRRATIYVRPEWHQWDEAAREQFFIHELVHIMTGEFICFIDDTLEDLLGDISSGPGKIVNNIYRKKLEGLTEELKRAFTEGRLWKTVNDG